MVVTVSFCLITNTASPEGWGPFVLLLVSPGRIPGHGRYLDLSWMDESEMLSYAWVTRLGVWAPTTVNNLLSSPFSLSTCYYSFTSFGHFPPGTLIHSIPVLISNCDPPLFPGFFTCCRGKWGLCGQWNQQALHIGAVGRLPPEALINENKCIGWGQNMRGHANWAEKKK